MQSLFLLVPLFTAGFCFAIAPDRGRNRWVWTALGFLVPLIAVVLILSLPKRGSEAAAV